MPDINLEGLAPSKEEIDHAPLPPTTKVVRPDPQLEIMLRVLESERGMSIDLPTMKAAQALRFKFYRSRQAQQRRENYSLDGIIFTLETIEEGVRLKMVKAAALVVNEL